MDGFKSVCVCVCRIVLYDVQDVVYPVVAIMIIDVILERISLYS